MRNIITKNRQIIVIAVIAAYFAGVAAVPVHTYGGIKAATPSEAEKAEDICAGTEPEKEKELEPEAGTEKEIEEVLSQISDKSTPSEALEAATASEAAMPEAEPPLQEKVKFKHETPDFEEIPVWYTRVKYKSTTYYKFTDRNNQIQYRIYGYYDECDEAEWYVCNERAEVTNYSEWVDFEWEDMNLAPYRYRSFDVTDSEWLMLEQITENTALLQREILDDKTGQNYDGTFYDVWCISEDLKDFEIPVHYYMYGEIINSEASEAKWFKCNEQGNVEGECTKPETYMLLRSGTYGEIIDGVENIGEKGPGGWASPYTAAQLSSITSGSINPKVLRLQNNVTAEPSKEQIPVNTLPLGKCFVHTPGSSAGNGLWTYELQKKVNGTWKTALPGNSRGYAVYLRLNKSSGNGLYRIYTTGTPGEGSDGQTNFYRYYSYFIINAVDYNLRFDGNGGTGGGQRRVSGGKPIGKLPASERYGYTFKGWYKERSMQNKIAETTLMPDCDTIYYAGWEADKYLLYCHLVTNEVKEKEVTFDKEYGELPTDYVEDFAFDGWYAATPSEAHPLKVYADNSLPEESKKINEQDVCRTAENVDVYSYFTLLFEELENGTNRRPGGDGIFGTDDDNYYWNGEDKKAGTADDKKIYPGEDGIYGTEDDYYIREDGEKVYPGEDLIFGTEDDIVGEPEKESGGEGGNGSGGNGSGGDGGNSGQGGSSGDNDDNYITEEITPEGPQESESPSETVPQNPIIKLESENGTGTAGILQKSRHIAGIMPSQLRETDIPGDDETEGAWQEETDIKKAEKSERETQIVKEAVQEEEKSIFTVMTEFLKKGFHIGLGILLIIVFLLLTLLWVINEKRNKN